MIKLILSKLQVIAGWWSQIAAARKYQQEVNKGLKVAYRAGWNALMDETHDLTDTPDHFLGEFAEAWKDGWIDAKETRQTHQRESDRRRAFAIYQEWATRN